MKIKRIIYTTLLIIWMIVIFMFSNQNGNTSKSTSDKVASTVVDTVEVVTKTEITDKEKKTFIEDTRFIIRKCAHFFLYFILGILSYLTLSSYGISKGLIIYSILLCFIYSISDEIHQLFSGGRSFKILDIFIDTTASITGIMLCFGFNKIILKSIKLNN